MPPRKSLIAVHARCGCGKDHKVVVCRHEVSAYSLIAPILLPCEDEIVENTTSFHSVSYHRILQNAVVTSVVIATGKAMHKKVRSGRCFAAHY